MARIPGTKGELMVDISSAATGSAVLVTFISSSKRSFQTATFDVTAYEDANLVYVAGKADASATYEGFLDTSTDQTWYPARDGVSRKFYDYIDTANNPNKYWFGLGIFDFSVDQSVSDAAKVSINMKAASSIGRSWV